MARVSKSSIGLQLDGRTSHVNEVDDPHNEDTAILGAQLPRLNLGDHLDKDGKIDGGGIEFGEGNGFHDASDSEKMFGVKKAGFVLLFLLFFSFLPPQSDPFLSLPSGSCSVRCPFLLFALRTTARKNELN